MSGVALAFVHGWGFDSSFWEPLRAHLPGIPAIAFDLGFRAPYFHPLPPQGARMIAVGHSAGLLWLLHQRPFAWQAMVAINGFSRFVAGDDFPTGVASRVLDRMIQRFSRDPTVVAAEFLSRCGAAGEVGTLDIKRGAVGLEWLRTWDERAALAQDRGPLLVLAARNDPIMPMAATVSCFDGRPHTTIHWHDDGGHLLPRTAPAWCAGHVRDFVRELEI